MFSFKKALRSLREVFSGFHQPAPPARPRPTISNPIANLEEIEIPGTGRYIDLDSSRPHLTLDVPETSLHIQFGPDEETIGIYEAVLEMPTSSLARTLHRLSLEGRVQRYSLKTSRARSTSLISASPLAPLYYDAVRRPTTPGDLVQSRKPRLVNRLTQAYHSHLRAEPSTLPLVSTNTMAYITRPRKHTYRDSCTLSGGFHHVSAPPNTPVYNSVRVVEPPNDAMSTGAYSTVINESYARASTMFGEAHPGAGEYYCRAAGRPGTPGGAIFGSSHDDEDVSADTAETPSAETGGSTDVTSADTVGTSSAETGDSGVSTDATLASNTTCSTSFSTTTAPTSTAPISATTAPTSSTGGAGAPTTTCSTSFCTTAAPITTTNAGAQITAAPTPVSKVKKTKQKAAQKVKDVFGKLRNKCRSRH